ncbi:hypothetical protein DUZ99_10645 [Xylanibacillus composti]|uniref:Uncharacterized protein n=1 Tax=Xylanibacillus composti TaxID=1572762 RepID=A0A8J4H4X6_9BACL|nr:hypothetical protein [Xylanibacillus composti]MDT9725428.1 hypothetical protein [Xylanibacillus composti]GIQ71057.1 hypothetical protein XYCOK13_38810 [Xylanibacillus composti]
MNKKLGRVDYFLTLGFIFVLICIIAAFFFGYQMGMDRTEAKYASNAEGPADEPLYTAYDQQYLVSFYHTVLSPYKEFQNKWFEHTRSLTTGTSTADPKAVARELAKLAENQHAKLTQVSMPNSSPLLQNAQTSYLRSLKLFAEGLKELDLKSGNANELLELMNQDAYLVEAKAHALQGQRDYFASMVKWNEGFDLSVHADELFAHADPSIEQWQAMNLIAKNYTAAKQLYESRLFEPFYPQDAAARIDRLLETGQASKLEVTNIRDFLQLLADTEAIREDDFMTNKDSLYANEVMPQLPFFSAIK